MEWTFAVVPVALCGAMCIGSAALAAIGLRRSRRGAGGGQPLGAEAVPDAIPEEAER